MRFVELAVLLQRLRLLVGRDALFPGRIRVCDRRHDLNGEGCEEGGAKVAEIALRGLSHFVHSSFQCLIPSEPMTHGGSQFPAGFGAGAEAAAVAGGG